MWRTDEDIEKAAQQLRIRLGIDDQSRPDMPTVIYKLKAHGIIKDYRRVPDNEMPNDEASFDSETRTLNVRESTFCAANAMYALVQAKRQRARFTIAHEIGHAILNHTGIRFRGTSAATAEKTVFRTRREENEANRFAGAFLAPAYLIAE